jgi:predicted ATP-dependent serine protease
MRRYLEGETVKEIAHAGNTSQETINRNQHLALRLFAEWLGEQEAAAWTALQNSTLAALPPKSFGRLFGHQSEASRLFRRLASAEAPWVIAVTGIGGIGKTSLINQVARRLAASPRYKRMIWLQADEAGLNEQRLIENLSRRLLPVGLPASRRLSALQAVLKATPTLVVLDNLDSG